MIAKTFLLFVLAGLAEIGGVHLVWTGLRDDKGPLYVAAGVLALAA